MPHALPDRATDLEQRERGGGNFDTPTVVLVHGALNDHTVWDGQVRALQLAGFPTLAPDLPGHGAGTGAGLSKVEDMAAWLLERIGAAGLGRVLLAGHSMGALIALDAARQAPAIVAGLSLLGATYPMRVSADLLAQARDDEAAAIAQVAQWSHAPEASAAKEASIALMRRMAAGGNGNVLHKDLNACATYRQGEVAARALRCPVQCVFGTRDRMTPIRFSAGLTGALPDPRIVEIDAGHQMMSEQSEAVARALVDFARALSRPG